MVCLATLENRDAEAGDVRLFGPPVTPSALEHWERLVAERRVKSVTIHVNRGDPVPAVSYLPGAAVRWTLDLLGGHLFSLSCHSMTLYQANVSC